MLVVGQKLFVRLRQSVRRAEDVAAHPDREAGQDRGEEARLPAGVPGDQVQVGVPERCRMATHRGELGEHGLGEVAPDRAVPRGAVEQENHHVTRGVERRGDLGEVHAKHQVGVVRREHDRLLGREVGHQGRGLKRLAQHHGKEEQQHLAHVDPPRQGRRVL